MYNSVEHYLFGIPVYDSRVAGIKLESIQDEITKVLDDVKKTNSFKRPEGWNSSTHLVSDPTFQTDFVRKCPILKEEIHYHVCNFLENIGSYVPINNYKITSSWLTQTQKGQHAHLHAHGENDIAGVYYHTTNEDDGSIFFESPVEVLKSSFCFRHLHKRLRFKPEVGKIMLFPAWLLHGVSENTSDHERISVSFNITFNRFNQTRY